MKDVEALTSELRKQLDGAINVWRSVPGARLTTMRLGGEVSLLIEPVSLNGLISLIYRIKVEID